MKLRYQLKGSFSELLARRRFILEELSPLSSLLTANSRFIQCMYLARWWLRHQACLSPYSTDLKAGNQATCLRTAALFLKPCNKLDELSKSRKGELGWDCSRFPASPGAI